MPPLQTITFPLCSGAPIQFHPADVDQHTRHISPCLRRSACLSDMGKHRHLSFSCYLLVMIPAFFRTKICISKDEFRNLNGTWPRQTLSKGWSILAGVERHRHLLTHSFDLLIHECKVSLRLRAVDTLQIKSMYFVSKYRPIPSPYDNAQIT